MGWYFILAPLFGFLLMGWALCRSAADGDESDLGSRTPAPAGVEFCDLCDSEVVWLESRQRAVCSCGLTSLPRSLLTCSRLYAMPAVEPERAR